MPLPLVFMLVTSSALAIADPRAAMLALAVVALAAMAVTMAASTAPRGAPATRIERGGSARRRSLARTADTRAGRGLVARSHRLRI